MKFSQRIGITPETKLVQVESMDDELRNSLWSILCAFYWDTYQSPRHDFGSRNDYISRSNLHHLFEALWFNYFKQPTDTIPQYFYDPGGGYGRLRDYFYSAKWYEVYDFLEAVAFHGHQQAEVEFTQTCNSVLERENSAYRFVNGNVVEISSGEEVEELETAIENAHSFLGAKQHLQSALLLLKDRSNPDYRNSVKESISAVESICKELVGNDRATLGQALTELESKKGLHPALKKAFSSMYGYTSDSDGIRHALMEESTLTKTDARFMLVSCSAFINYLIDSTQTKV